MTDEPQPGVDYPKWLTEDLIEETIRQFAHKKKDGPFTREDAVDILLCLATLLDVTGVLKVDLGDIDVEPSAAPTKQDLPVPLKQPKPAKRRATNSRSKPKSKDESVAKSKTFTCFADLANEVTPPEDGTLSRTLHNDDNTKVVLFGFGAGEELSEHTASMPAIIQIIKGEASLTVGDESVAAKPGTWIHMAAKTPHSVKAKTPVVMLLTLLK